MKAYFKRVRWMLLAGLWLCSGGLTATPLTTGPERLVLAVMPFEEHAIATARWQPVLAEINRRLQGKLVLELRLLDFGGLEQAVRYHEVDFIMSNAAIYTELARTYGLSSPLLSAVMLHDGIPMRGMGGVIVVRNGPGEPKKMSDLNGQTVAFPGWSSFGGYLMQLKVLQDQGIPASKLNWLPTGMPHDSSMQALLDGRADVAFVRTGVLESMLERGLIRQQDFYILNDQQLTSFPLYLSTQLYPEWPLGAMSHVKSLDAAWVTGAFLSLDGEALDMLKHSGIENFTIPADYRVVENMMKSLGVRPFHIEAPVTLQEIWRTHKLLVILLVVLVVTVILFSLVLLFFNRKLYRALVRLRSHEETQRIAAVAFQTSEAIIIADADEQILNVNRAFCKITGYEREEVLGKTPRLFQSGRHDLMFYQQMWSTLLNQGAWSGEIWNRKKDGTIFPLYQQITAVRDQQDSITHYISSFSDISLRKEAEQRIEQLAYYDILTGAANRRLMVQHIQQALEQQLPAYKAVLYVDLDHFKQLNDALGYEAGDELLRQAAQRIESVMGAEDRLGRLAGDDFVVLLNPLEAEQAGAVCRVQDSAQQIQQVLAREFILVGHRYSMTASVGISLFAQTEYQAEEVLKQSEMAMYQAKADGRAAIRFFDPAMQEMAIRKAFLERNLREAVREEQFVLYYQPKMDTQGGLHGYEVLLRWQLSDGQMVSPEDFIPLAEESGLIIPMGRWIIDQAVQQIRAWQQQPGKEHLVLAINVSARQFSDESLVDDVRQAIEDAQIPGHLLELEITESMLLGDFEGTRTRMTDLQALGVGFAMDDFGTGYSSLNYLKKLPLSSLKIDQSFVRDMLNSRDDAAIVQTIITLAKSLHLVVVAEGVETAEQAAYLRELGCDLLQGYYFGRPAPLVNDPAAGPELQGHILTLRADKNSGQTLV